ncbi:MAG: alanine/ornithine racemase family PLP-dependent enzyme [Burkholderiaceae bacterium]|nr:alanine/ornithine racemase family PLP-dependent enzyme [Burkholderiaceae bacterium]
MSSPLVTIDLRIIERNARAVVERCRSAGIEVFGVTKATCGTPEVAHAMLRAGVAGLAESRLENILRLRAAGIACPMMLLRVPALSQAEQVVRHADLSLNSELNVIAALSQAAQRLGAVHKIMLMVDLGDLREGIWPHDLLSAVAQIVRLPGVAIVGLGTNLNCLGGVLPSADNLGTLAALAEEARNRFGLELPYVSGGNSGSLPLLLAGGMPAGVNQLRIGEAMLQGGRDTFYDDPWAALDRGAFTLSAELVELKTKPSVPIGRTGVDAFGRTPQFVSKGDHLRGILNIGLQDINAETLFPLSSGVGIVGASSDHLIVDLHDLHPAPRVGDCLEFRMGYGSLLKAMTSPYVHKELLQ